MDPGVSTPLMWALFPSWSPDAAAPGPHPVPGDRHFDTSDKAVLVDFAVGHAVEESRGWGLNDVQRGHGALMFLAWGMLYPISAIANRHLKPRGGPLFFKVHVGMSLLALLFVIIAFGIIHDFVDDEGAPPPPLQHAR